MVLVELGRLVLRASMNNPNVKIRAINDPFIDLDYLVYMLKYDTVHGQFNASLEAKDGYLFIDGNKITVSQEMDPSKIQWGDADADYVCESTGAFTTVDKARQHLVGGAKKVVISAPSGDAPMFVMGVNEDKYDSSMDAVSNASCYNQLFWRHWPR
eukprot:TRINITY_DN1126_c0_g2_i1.p2 TRINITY_DN1126_c0_g2~~TRINITY_DN1126_c0_g2_i1.p2  ORF type:complete len:156 (-),score=28.53 TRINITY_DN1126_c0_g2_i1:904-1371(-)